MTHPEPHKPIIYTPETKTPRVVITPTSSNKWKACIYFSAHDLTGTILLYLQSVKKDTTGTFQKMPIYAFTAKDKISIEIKLQLKLKTILKNN